MEKDCGNKAPGSFCLYGKEQNSLKVGLPPWTWYYKKDKGGVTRVVLKGHGVCLQAGHHCNRCSVKKKAFNVLDHIKYA